MKKKALVLTLILAVFLSALAGTLYFGTVSASADGSGIPKPSSPDFTAKAVANTLEVTIKNQLLTSYENGSYPGLYYMFRFKDHNTEEGFWDYDPVYFVLPSTYGGYHRASDSEFTVVSLSLESHHFPSGQIDIQAIALVGNQYPTDMQNGTVYGFEGVISGWSNYQTLVIEEGPTPTPEPTLAPTITPTEEPQQTGEDMTAGSVFAVASIVVFLGLLFYFIKRK